MAGRPSRLTIANRLRHSIRVLRRTPMLRTTSARSPSPVDIGYLIPPASQGRPTPDRCGPSPMVGRVALFASMVNGGPAVFQAPFTTAVGRINNATRNCNRSAAPRVVRRRCLSCSRSPAVPDAERFTTSCTYWRKAVGSVVWKVPHLSIGSDADVREAVNARENRRSKMNAGPAVIDLFRLIDYQNGKRDDKKFTIHYPDARTTKAITLEQGLLQTAVLFGGSRSDGPRGCSTVNGRVHDFDDERSRSAARRSIRNLSQAASSTPPLRDRRPVQAALAGRVCPLRSLRRLARR